MNCYINNKADKTMKLRNILAAAALAVAAGAQAQPQPKSQPATVKPVESKAVEAVKPIEAPTK